MANLVPWARDSPWCTDGISVRNLKITLQHGTDAWQRSARQPAHLSVSLSLKEPFASAASSDTVDGSTVHYGKLSKALLRTFSETPGSSATTGIWRAFSEIEDAMLEEVASKEALRNVLVELMLPKGSMLGDGVALSRYVSYSEVKVEKYVMQLKDVRIPTLVGVNPHERQMKQPLVVNLWLYDVAETALDKFSDLERMLIKELTREDDRTNVFRNA
ncbi:hypothetical protein LTR50_005385 [Elasticomyces elasticus]|nr:hypothetical protein LTR50_005385 [Elasticomyces elasticus]